MYRTRQIKVSSLPRSCPSCGKDHLERRFTYHYNREEMCHVCQRENWQKKMTEQGLSPGSYYRSIDPDKILPFTKWSNVQIRKMLSEEQGGKCKLCEKETVLCIDHDHETKRVRGLLCQECNKALAAFKNIEITKRAMRYLDGCK